MANHHSKLTVCPNCGTQLGFNDNFCPTCGQENHEVKLPLGHILYEFVESITHFDNKLWNSLKAIFTRPGKMTAEFLEGKRMRYVPPARLYVFVSVIFFFLIGKFADHQLQEGIKTLKNASGAGTTDASKALRVDLDDLINNDSLLHSRGLYRMAREIGVSTSLTKAGLARAARRIKRLELTQLDSVLKEANLLVVDSNQTKLRELIALVPQEPAMPLTFSNMMGKEFKTKEEQEEYEEKLGQMSNLQIDSLIRAEGSTPGWLSRKLYRQQGKFSHLLKGDDTHELLHAIMKNFSIVMFILMPFVAILLLLFYFRRGRYYYEHLIFSVHIHTVIFLLFSIALAATFFARPELTFSFFIGTFWVSWLYFLLSLKRVYQQTWGKTILKFFLLSAMYGFTALFFLLGALGVGFLTF